MDFPFSTISASIAFFIKFLTTALHGVSKSEKAQLAGQSL